MIIKMEEIQIIKDKIEEGGEVEEEVGEIEVDIKIIIIIMEKTTSLTILKMIKIKQLKIIR